MDNTTDQTNFWLAWQATCAAVKCIDRDALEKACAADANKYASVLRDIDGTQDLAKKIVISTNKNFRDAMSYWRANAGNRVSDLDAEMEGWSAAAPQNGCAFMLLEGHLYAKEKIKGRPFKKYLFENIATRSGDLSGNLYGYIKRMLSSLARKSFNKTPLYEPKVDESGKPIDEEALSTDTSDGFMALPPCDQTEINEVAEFFRCYVDELGASQADEAPVWTCDNWIALYCAIHQIPISTPEVVKHCRLKKSAVAIVSEKTLNSLWRALCARFSNKAIARAFQSRIPGILDEKMKNMPFYSDLERIRVERVK